MAALWAAFPGLILLFVGGVGGVNVFPVIGGWAVVCLLIGLTSWANGNDVTEGLRIIEVKAVTNTWVRYPTKHKTKAILVPPMDEAK